MSGGGSKKKPAKAQGWEEAGSEFYQESYPTDAEIEVFQKDPKHLATLLPSKQNRVATTIRVRTNDKTMRRQSSNRAKSRRESTVNRRASTAGEVQVSMLPDLSENLSNEQTTWEEIMEIKATPVSMAQKREMKAKILNEPNLRLQGYEQFKWKRRKIWQHFLYYFQESHSKLELWKSDLKKIEGHFGTGIVAYFLFLKWLLFLNIFIFSIIFLFIALPTQLLIANYDCYSSASNYSYGSEIILDLIQGTGLMECSLLFYGFYPNETFLYNTENTPMYYNLPLAYICITLLYFLASLILIVRAAAKGFKERLIESQGQFYRYCNLVFGGWDFCIHNGKSARIKHKAIYNEIKGCLETERLQELKLNRTKNDKVKLFMIRFVVNSVVVGVLIACGCAIYFIFDFCNNQVKNDCLMETCWKNFKQLFYEFATSVSIVFMNILVPFVFRYLITFENYTPVFIVRITLLRTVFLRLSSLIVLYASLHEKVNNKNEEGCWETFVGQQIYKLVLTDFATHIFVTFFINFPRAILANHVNSKFIKFIGEQSFDLPKHVLDIVYIQTLCWLGCFFAPFLSLIFTVIFLFMFYIKKFACLVNSKPSSTIYRVSRSNSMFMIVLLVSFVFAGLPIAYSISELKPSENCGPFRGLPSVWTEIVNTFMETPFWLQDFAFFFSTAGFAVPLLIILLLLLYYYTAINSANKHMVAVLKNQLVLEGHDKQFLLERLSKFIKHHQQENQKRLKHVNAVEDLNTHQLSNN